MLLVYAPFPEPLHFRTTDQSAWGHHLDHLDALFRAGRTFQVLRPELIGRSHHLRACWTFQVLRSTLSPAHPPDSSSELPHPPALQAWLPTRPNMTNRQMKDTTHAARPMKYTRHQWKTHGGNKTQHRAIETHPGNPDAGCEDLCGAINGYLIVPTPASDELRWTANRNILTPLSFILNILSEIYLLDIYFKKETDIWSCWPSPVMSSPCGASVNR